MNEKIYTFGSALGDVWASVSWAIQESKRTGTPTILADHYIRKKNGNRKDVRELLLKTIALFIDGEKHIKVVDQEGNIDLLWNIRYDHIYEKTKLQWMPTKSNIVSYQFDGRSHPQKKMKAGQVEELINFLTVNGFKPMNTGGDKATGGGKELEDRVEIISKAQFHVGVDSGLIHVGRSVGTPTVLIKNGLCSNYFKIYNKHPKLTVVNDLEAFKIWVQEFKSKVDNP